MVNQRFYLFVSGVDQGNEEGDEVSPRSPCVTLVVWELFLSHTARQVA